MLYRKQCGCENAGASTARLKVHLDRDRREPDTRQLDLSIVMSDLRCDVCEKPWKAEVVE